MAGTYRFGIAPRDVDASLCVRLTALGELILQAAADDADMLGFGVGDLNLSNASWVLSRMAVEMQRLPVRGENIDVYTWVSDYGRLFTTRNMTVSVDGEQIGAAVTQWAMIDLATRRPLDLSALSNKGTSLVDRLPPIAMPQKVGGGNAHGGLGGGRDAGTVTRTAVYSDVDFNNHVGAMRYLSWMVDMLPAAPAAPVRVDINYLHEARLGDILTVDGANDPTGTSVFDIKNSAGTSICRAAIRKQTINDLKQ
jgi:acyl-ACP thioesterase